MSNALRQAKFKAAQRAAGRRLLSIWVTDAQAAQIEVLLSGNGGAAVDPHGSDPDPGYAEALALTAGRQSPAAFLGTAHRALDRFSVDMRLPRNWRHCFGECAGALRRALAELQELDELADREEAFLEQGYVVAGQLRALVAALSAHAPRFAKSWCARLTALADQLQPPDEKK